MLCGDGELDLKKWKRRKWRNYGDEEEEDGEQGNEDFWKEYPRFEKREPSLQLFEFGVKRLVRFL